MSNPEPGRRSILEQRLERILKAVALEKPDRVPVVLEYAGFAAQVTKTPLAEFVSSPLKATQTMIKAFELVSEKAAADAVNYGSFWPYGLCHLFASKVRVPGVDLPADEMWQVVETELMSAAEYERILKLGWPAWFKEFMAERILDDAAEHLLPPNLPAVDVRAEWARVNVPVLTGGDAPTPLELLCGARSLTKFAFDMIETPDKVQAVMDEMAPHLGRAVIARAKAKDFPAVWVGGWRAAPAMLSPRMWDRFVWPYFVRLVHEVVDSGLIAILHLDSNWDRELKRFRELPRGRCLMALDGETDIFKAKAVLGDHMCLMGDVPASMLYLASPAKVYEYSARLIRELGPEGFILQSGCDIPTNANLKNVQAMVAAASG